MKKAIFPGTFDPFTTGHASIVRRALTFMDEIIIGIGVNDKKKDSVAYRETSADGARLLRIGATCSRRSI